MLYKKLWLNLWVFAVTTFAVVWIEIYIFIYEHFFKLVTTFAVVWIEMQYYNPFLYLPSSYFHNSVE